MRRQSLDNIIEPIVDRTPGVSHEDRHRGFGRLFDFAYAVLVAGGKWLYTFGENTPLEKNLFIIPKHHVITRDEKFFWVYLLLGLVAVLSLTVFRKKHYRRLSFFLLALLPLLHYMEPALKLTEFGKQRKRSMAGRLLLREVFEKASDRSIYHADGKTAAVYVARNRRDKSALKALQRYLAAHEPLYRSSLGFARRRGGLVGAGLPGSGLRDDELKAQLALIKRRLLAEDNSFLKPYLSEGQFGRFLEVGADATPHFSFFYHNTPYANVIFNLGGNVGRPHKWRWFPQFDYFFPPRSCNDCSWYLEPEVAIERSWTLNLMGVRHLIISENLYQRLKDVEDGGENLLDNPSFEEWSAGPHSAPDGWEVLGSGIALERSDDSRDGSFSLALTRGGEEYGKVVQNVWEKAGGESARGKIYTFSALVKASKPNAQLFIRDYYSDARSLPHSGSGEWEFLSVSKLVHSQAPILEVSFHLTGKGQARFDKMMFSPFQLFHNLRATNSPGFFSKYQRFLQLPVEGVSPGVSSNKNKRIVQLKNEEALPLMFLADGYRVLAPGADRREKWKLMSSLDYRNTLLLEEEPLLPETQKAAVSSEGGKKQGDVEIIDIRGNIAAARVNVRRPYSFLFYSDNYHPDWVALVDGRPTKVYRADLAFKALLLEKGKHLLWLEFRPRWLWRGFYISTIALLLILLAAARRYLADGRLEYVRVEMRRVSIKSSWKG